MTRRLLLAILLLAACNASAKGSPSNEQDNPLQVQTSPGDFGNENEKPFELVLILGAMVFPVALICSYELCRSTRVRQLVPVGRFLPLSAMNPSQSSQDIGIFYCPSRGNSVISPSEGMAGHTFGEEKGSPSFRGFWGKVALLTGDFSVSGFLRAQTPTDPAFSVAYNESVHSCPVSRHATHAC
jgi:hypothetical protein